MKTREGPAVSERNESGALRILLIEDSEDDAVLISRTLARDGLLSRLVRVETLPDLRAALSGEEWDIILSDHQLPGLDSFLALSTVRASAGDIPFIVVSGTIGEETAVAAMLSGAQDYILKRSLSRLTPAIKRELREAASRRARRTAEEQLSYVRRHDALSGLLNRDEVERLVDEAFLGEGLNRALTTLGVIDVDGFSGINEAYGQAAGDEVLRRFATALATAFGNAGFLGRLGADEFAILLTGHSPENACRELAAFLERVSEEPVRWLGRTIALRASAGIASMLDFVNASEFLGAAMSSCHVSKTLGGGRVTAFDKRNPAIAVRRQDATWLPRLQEALERGQFVLFAQRLRPLRSSQDENRLFEVLLRLKNPDGSLVLPGEFLPSADRHHLMPRIDLWVLKTLLTHMERTKAFDGARRPSALVNLSGSSLGEEGFGDRIRALLETYQADPSSIAFEVTETSVIRDLPRALSLMNQLHQLGCSFVLDDFGTGLSSFAYLRALPVQMVKVDGGFVREMGRDDTARAVVESICHVARAAGLTTVAEWVEDTPTLARVRDAGLDWAQGYAVHTPEPLETAMGEVLLDTPEE